MNALIDQGLTDGAVYMTGLVALAGLILLSLVLLIRTPPGAAMARARS